MTAQTIGAMRALKSTLRKLSLGALPRANFLEPQSFLHDADDDHTTPTSDFAHEDTQQKDDAYDLDEM